MLFVYTDFLGPMAIMSSIIRVDISSTSLSTVKRLADLCTFLAFVITVATLMVVVALAWRAAKELSAHPPGRNPQGVSHPFHPCMKQRGPRRSSRAA